MFHTNGFRAIRQPTTRLSVGLVGVKDRDERQEQQQQKHVTVAHDKN